VVLLRTVAPTMASLAPVRREVAETLRRAGVSSPTLDELLVVQGELLANAIEASAGDEAIEASAGDEAIEASATDVTGSGAPEEGSAAPVEVTVLVRDGYVEIAVRGRASGVIPPVSAWRSPEASAPRGRGLFIVGALSDEVEVRQDGRVSVVVARRRLGDGG
jgi:anti-sigma regulatory factor (Ser/Thr protein kinase)